MNVKQPFTARHRGPYSFMVVRPFKTKKGFYRSEWLPGEVASWDVDEEARALLNDPRDTIVRVHVWSDKEEQFVHTFRKEAA